MVEGAPRRRGGLVEPLSKLGGGRPGETGATRLRVRARQDGCSASFIDPFLAALDEGLHNCIEWPADTPWSNGKVGLNGISYYENRCLGRLASLQPPHLAANVRVGGRSRLVSRHNAVARGTVSHLLGELVPRVAWKTIAVRRGRTRQAFARARRTRLRAPEKLSEDDCEEPHRLRARRCISSPLDDRLSQVRARQSGTGRRLAASRPRKGWRRPAPRGSFEGLIHAPRRGKSGWRRTASSTRTFYTDWGAGAGAQVLRLFPEGRGHRLGEGRAARAACRCAIPAKSWCRACGE